MSNYQLVNPHIEGNFKKIFSGNKPIQAGKKAWDNLSHYFSNPLKEFHFSLERLNDKKLYHFGVKEQMNGSRIDYTIKQMKLEENSDNKALKAFRQKLNEVQNGGRHNGGKHDDDSSSSSSSDSSSSSSSSDDKLLYKHYTNVEQPIVYWWYDPYIYKINRVHMPCFLWPLTPAVELSLTYVPLV
jgi:hypothetical protein